MPKLDPRALRPAELVRLLNSTPLGEVVRAYHVHAKQNRAGYRIGDGSRIDLVRYTAWLTGEWEAMKKGVDQGGYEVMKARARARNLRLSEAGRDIAPLPAVVNPERKAKGCASFRAFCEIYFPQTFYLPWSPDHLKVIARIEQVVLRGGLFALAMPRKSGKTRLCQRGAIWAILSEARRFVALIGATEDAAVETLEEIKSELETNDLLLEDFPEVVYPIRRLERLAGRSPGQLYEGHSTFMQWKERTIVFPTMPGSLASGAVLQVAGITGRIRGMGHKVAGGRSIRPSLVIFDDPQTDESASSLSQCEARERILAGAVLGLAEPGTKLTGIMPCTVIRPGDMADRLLDRERYPEWNGERMKTIYAWPTNTKFWDRYAEIRQESLRTRNDIRDATEFYREHRDQMDAGAEVAWPDLIEPDEISGVQHAMNLRLKNEAVFWAEYQNEPLAADEGLREALNADDVAGKTNGLARGQVPAVCSELTTFVDVHAKVLFYAVCAWQPDFTGCVVDYGTYPEQGLRYFRAENAQRTLRRAHQGAGVEGAIYAGLDALIGALLGREWPRDDGAAMRIGLCLVDQGWKPDVVHQFCRQSQHAGLLMPSRGAGITASQKPIAEYDRKRGDRIGHNWWIPAVKSGRTLRHLEVDTNFWKTFVHERFATAMGDRGCLSIFGRKPEPHQLFAEHLTAEYRVTTSGRGRTLEEWKLPAHNPDNHWLDCVVGCVAAASVRGVALATASGVKLGPTATPVRRGARKRVHYLAL